MDWYILMIAFDTMSSLKVLMSNSEQIKLKAVQALLIQLNDLFGQMGTDMHARNNVVKQQQQQLTATATATATKVRKRRTKNIQNYYCDKQYMPYQKSAYTQVQNLCTLLVQFYLTNTTVHHGISAAHPTKVTIVLCH